jgi:hypothetical protein
MRFIGPTIRFMFGASFGALFGLWLVVNIQDPIVFFGGLRPRTGNSEQ